jgi:D-glycero-D-manno-heptose 1,7-bisphosphate phosphatase
MKPAVFVDRDGTLIIDRGYLDRIDHMELLPGAVEALRLVREAGFAVVVVTNQAGVARGRFDEAFVPEAHRHLQALLSAGGASVDAYYYCPHHPEGIVEEYRRVCECRKPAPGMVQRAAREMSLDVNRSFVIGDTWLDVGLAARSGARGILVRTGYGASVEQAPPEGLSADAVVDTVLDAARYVVDQARRTAADR